jgi:hypothetical protein
VADLAKGIYEALLDEELSSILQRHPELRSVFGKLDPEEEPPRYAAFVSRVLERALQAETDPATRLRLCNEIIERIAGSPAGQWPRHSCRSEIRVTSLMLSCPRLAGFPLPSGLYLTDPHRDADSPLLKDYKTTWWI